MLQIITSPDTQSQQPPAVVRSIAASGPLARPMPVPALDSAPAQPELQGFHKAFSIQPILAQHGVANPVACHARGVGSLARALEKIAPQGFSVYQKPGAGMGMPVQYTCNGRPWPAVVKGLLKQIGAHGAIWWDNHILTLWPAPLLPTFPAHPPKPNLQGSTLTAISETKGAIARTPTAAFVPISQDDETIPAPSLSGATPVFVLNRGDLILTDLREWAKQSGWTVIWQVPEDWQVPNTTTFSGDFQKAVGQVIQALSANGANVHAVFHTANNTVVVSGAGGGE